MLFGLHFVDFDTLENKGGSSLNLWGGPHFGEPKSLMFVIFWPPPPSIFIFSTNLVTVFFYYDLNQNFSLKIVVGNKKSKIHSLFQP